jgi:hypothetical protein
MRNSKNVLFTLIITVVLSFFSSLALAEGGLPDIENVVAKLKESTAAIAAGASGDKVADLAKEAKDLTKEIIISDKITIARTRATAGIKNAITAAKKSDLKTADELLKKATEDFEGLKKLI